MSASRHTRLTSFAVITTLVVASGCGKESADESTPNQSNPTPAVAASANPSPTPASSATASLDSRFAESQNAINGRDYERAATTLLAVQQTPLTEQQAEMLAKQMRQLQNSLAGAVASGDPKAKAAADKLRAQPR